MFGRDRYKAPYDPLFELQVSALKAETCSAFGTIMGALMTFVEGDPSVADGGMCILTRSIIESRKMN